MKQRSGAARRESLPDRGEWLAWLEQGGEIQRSDDERGLRHDGAGYDRNDAAWAIGGVRLDVEQRLERAQVRYNGMDEDSYASRIEVRSDVGFLANFRAQLDDAEAGKPVDLSQTVTDYGYDEEAAFTAERSGMTYVREERRLQAEHETHIANVAPLVDQLRAAGVEVDTSFHLIEPPDHSHEEKRPVVVMSGREWWEDQRADILASNIPAAEAQRQLEELGPEPPDGDVYLDPDGRLNESAALEVDPINVVRTTTEEPAPRGRAVGRWSTNARNRSSSGSSCRCSMPLCSPAP